jgi:Histone methyltransferase Tudor domain 1
MSDDDRGAGLQDGAKIEARYKGKNKYYPGVISRKRLNGTFDIDYDDGEKEYGVSKELIRMLGVAS